MNWIKDLIIDKIIDKILEPLKLIEKLFQYWSKILGFFERIGFNTIAATIISAILAGLIAAISIIGIPAIIIGIIKKMDNKY